MMPSSAAGRGGASGYAFFGVSPQCMHDLTTMALQFQMQVVAAEHRCTEGLSKSRDKAAECAEKVRSCTNRIAKRELEWGKEKLALRNELRSIYARFSKTQGDTGAGSQAAVGGQEEGAMENKHLQAAVHEYSAMIHSLEETCRRLTDELSVSKHDHALSVNCASALVGDLESILQGEASEAQRQRALDRIRAFKNDPGHFMASSRPTSLTSDGGLMSPRSVPRAGGRPSSTASAQGRLASAGPVSGGEFAVKSEAELQSGMQQTSAKIDQLVQIARRLSEHDHHKIFQDIGRADPNAQHMRTKSTVGLVLSNNCVIQNIVTGGPAFHSRQFSPGDRIVAVDGIKVDADNIHATIKGSDIVGSIVEVSVIPPGADSDSQIRRVKLSRTDAEQIANRLEMMELFARLKVLVQTHPEQNSVQATTMVDKTMFAYSKGLTYAADADRKLRSNLTRLEQQERQRLSELLTGLGSLASLQKHHMEYAMQTIKTLDGLTAEEKERSMKMEESLRGELARVQRERDAAVDSYASLQVDFAELRQEFEMMKGARAEADALSKRVADLLQAVQQLSGNLEECKIANHALEGEKSVLVQQNDASQREKEDIKEALERALARMTNLNQDLTSKVDKQRSEIDDLNKALREWSGHSEKLAAQLSEAHKTADQLRSDTSDKIAGLQSTTVDLGRDLSNRNAELDHLRKECTALQQTKQNLQSLLTKESARAVEAEEELAALQVELRQTEKAKQEIQIERDNLKVEKNTLLAELKENYRKMREDIGEARMSHEQKESRLTAELGAREEELRAARARIRTLEDTQRELVAAMAPVTVVMKLDMEFASVSAPGSPQREALEKLLKLDVSRAARISADSIKIKEMTPGSVNVAMEFYPDSSGGPDPHSAALDLKKQVNEPDSALRSAPTTGAAVSVTVPDKKAMLEKVEALEKDAVLKAEELAMAQAEIQELNHKLRLKRASNVALEGHLASANDSIQKHEKDAALKAEELAIAKTEIQELNENLRLEKASNVALKGHLASANDSIQKQEENIEALKTSVNGLEETLAAAAKEISRLKEERLSLQEEISEHKGRISQQQDQISTDMHTLSGKSVQIEELHASLAELQATTEREMNAANTALEQSMAETLKAEKEVSGLQRELHDSSVQVAEASRKMDQMQERLDGCQKDLENQIASRKQETSVLQLSLAEETARVRAATDEMADMSLTLKDLERRVGELTEENDMYKRKVNEILQQHDTSDRRLQSEVSKLSKENAEMATDYKATDQLAQDRLKQMDRMKAQLNEIRDTMTSLQESLASERALSENLKMQVAELSETLEQCRRDVAATRQIIAERDASLAAAQRMSEDAGKEILQLNTEMANQQDTLNEQRDEISRLESELDSSNAELDELTAQVKMMTDVHISSRSQIAQLESSKHELMADLSSARMHEQEELKLRHQLAHARHDIKRLDAEAEVEAGKVKKLQAELSTSQSELDRTMVKLVMEEEGHIRDVQKHDDKLLEMAQRLEDTRQDLRDMQALLTHQKIAANVVHSMLDQVPDGSVGIAIEGVLNSEGFPVVSSVSQYSSAAMSLEVQKGDVITIVDGVSVHGCKVSEVLQRLRGAIGTHVILQGYHPDSNEAPYVVSLSRGAQNHSLSTSRPGENYDAVVKEDETLARNRTAYVMSVAKQALQSVCLLAFQHSIAKRIFLTYERLDPDVNNLEFDLMRSPYIKDLASANQSLDALRVEYASWCDRYVSLETQEELFEAFAAFQAILQKQPFVDARFASQVRLHEQLKKYAQTPEDVLLSFVSLHPATPD